MYLAMSDNCIMKAQSIYTRPKPPFHPRPQGRPLTPFQYFLYSTPNSAPVKPSMPRRRPALRPRPPNPPLITSPLPTPILRALPPRMARRRTTTRHTRVIRFLVFLLFLFLRLVVRAEGAGELVGGAVGGVGAGCHFDGMADGCVGLYK